MEKLFNSKWLTAIFFVLPVIIFSPVLFAGKGLFYRDIILLHYPLVNFKTEALKNFGLPWWNPYLFSGFPETHIFIPTFYPTIIFYLFLPFQTALVFSLLAHYFLAGLGVYLMARKWNYNNAASLTAGILFMFNGYMFDLTSLEYILYAITWLPYLVLFTEKFVEKGGLKDFTLLVFFFVLVMATGRFDYFYFDIIFLALWVIRLLVKTEKTEKPAIYKKSLLLLLAPVFTVLLLSPEIFPSLDFLRTTMRSGGLGIDEASFWSMTPAQSLLLLFSNLYGKLQDIYSSGLLVAITDQKFSSFFICNLYLGLPALLLAVYALKTKKAGSGFLASLAAFFLILSLGRYTPVFPLLFKIFPLFSMGRFPVKFMIYPIFCISLLAGGGLDTLDRGEKDYFRKMLFFSLAALILVICGLYSAETKITAFLNPLLGGKYDTHIDNLNFMLRSMALSVIILLTEYLLLMAEKLGKLKAGFLGLLLFGVVCLDLGINAAADLMLKDRSAIISEPEIARDLDRLLTDKSRYYIVHDDEPAISDFKRNNEGLYYNLPMNYKIRDFYGEYLSAPTRIAKIYLALNDNAGSIRLSGAEKSRLMKVMGIRFFIANKNNRNLSPFDSKYFTLVKDYGPEELQLWEVKDYQPAVAFRTKVLNCSSGNELFATLLGLNKNPGYDEKTVLVTPDERAGIDFPGIQAIGNAERIKNPVSHPMSEPRLENMGNNSFEAVVENQEPGFLITGSNYYPGWGAVEDGREIPVVRVNYCRMAVFLPPGKHHLKFSYSPPGFRLYLGISSFSLSIFGFLIFLVFRGRKV